MGYMMDGFGIYGPRGENGNILTSSDLDVCHGHTHPVLWDGQMVNIYHYHWTYDFPYNIGCYKGTRVASSVNEMSRSPENFALQQNYPNPFNPSTRIAFSVHVSVFTSLKVFDVLGREVTTLVNDNLDAGTYDVTFNANELSGGVYYYRLQAGNFVATKRMLLLQ
jgi:hypothetical protein